jgi:Sec-independent protein translocase protein TatA
MPPLITELGLAALITASGSSLAALIGSLVQGMKTRAEVAQMRRHVGESIAATKEAMETAQHELTHNHGSSMKDASTRTEGKVDALAEELQVQTQILARQGEQLDGVRAEQTRQGDAIHGLDRGVGGLRDENRQTRKHGDDEHDSIRDDIRVIRDDIRKIQADMNLPGPGRNAVCGWDYGDHQTNFRAPGRDHDTQEDT